jgi:hypothetical protein
LVQKVEFGPEIGNVLEICCLLPLVLLVLILDERNGHNPLAEDLVVQELQGVEGILIGR